MSIGERFILGVGRVPGEGCLPEFRSERGETVAP
jgi:hypothetical protein